MKKWGVVLIGGFRSQRIIFKVLKELKESNVNEINAKSREKLDSNVAITFKSNIFSNEYSMIVTGLNSEGSKGSVVFVKNNSSNNMLICMGKRYTRSEAKNVFYCSSCGNVGSKMKPSKTLRTAIKVIDGKIVFQNEHVDGCEDILIVKCFFLSLQISMSFLLTPTEYWRKYLYKITILCNNTNIKYEDFIKHNDFTDRKTFINSINRKRNNCNVVLDLELTFYNNESYVFHGDEFIF
uniref:BRCT domain-containing protein n=1 Tax=Strongyloides venezuelensis TaxID=75913 RepID=A0A0K0FR78_STRVS